MNTYMVWCALVVPKVPLMRLANEYIRGICAPRILGLSNWTWTAMRKRKLDGAIHCCVWLVGNPNNPNQQDVVALDADKHDQHKTHYTRLHIIIRVSIIIIV